MRRIMQLVGLGKPDAEHKQQPERHRTEARGHALRQAERRNRKPIRRHERNTLRVLKKCLRAGPSVDAAGLLTCGSGGCTRPSRLPSGQVCVRPRRSQLRGQSRFWPRLGHPHRVPCSVSSLMASKHRVSHGCHGRNTPSSLSFFQLARAVSSYCLSVFGRGILNERSIRNRGPQ
jgi:hypothetical protein